MHLPNMLIKIKHSVPHANGMKYDSVSFLIVIYICRDCLCNSVSPFFLLHANQLFPMLKIGIADFLGGFIVHFLICPSFWFTPSSLLLSFSPSPFKGSFSHSLPTAVVECCGTASGRTSSRLQSYRSRWRYISSRPYSRHLYY